MEANMKKQGLNGFQIKLIAMLLMLLDHIHYFLSGAFNVPIAFNWLGRIVAPIFIFMTAEGYYYTRNKKGYIKRLYIASVLMALASALVQRLFPSESIIVNSMFQTLFLLTIYLHGISLIKDGKLASSKKDIINGMILLVVPIVWGGVFLRIMGYESVSIIFIRLSMIFAPTIFTVEGGIVFVIMGVMFYGLRDHRILKFLPIVLIGALSLRGGGDLLYSNYQWMMVFSIPILYLYNGDRGPGNKYMFYLFYPLHIYALYIINCFLTK